MKRIYIYQIVLLILMISFFSTGCVQIPGISPAGPTPSASITPAISETSQAGTPVETARTQSNYKVFVDDYGFRRVIETTYKKEVEYTNLTLTIYVGDMVEWVNDNDYKITLISDQGLWTPGDIRAILMNRGINHTFTNPGTYTFRIKDEPRILPQTIIVKP